MMKKRFLKFGCFLLMATSITMFTSCDDDDDNNEESKEEIVTSTFEDVTLGETGYWNGSDLSGELKQEDSYGSTVSNYYGSFSSSAVNFNNLYTSEWASWTGFACSSLNDMTTAGYENQYSVYDKNGGVSGSAQFAVAFSDNATFKFPDNVQKKLKSVMVNNCTYAYLSIANGNNPAKKFEDNDYFNVTFTGYNASNTATGSVTFYLADFRNGKRYICDSWTNVNLTRLGSVHSVVITFGSSDVGDYGINTPTYVCLDNLTYIK